MSWTGVGEWIEPVHTRPARPLRFSRALGLAFGVLRSHHIHDERQRLADVGSDSKQPWEISQVMYRDGAPMIPNSRWSISFYSGRSTWEARFAASPHHR